MNIQKQLKAIILTQTGHTHYDPVYGSKRSVCKLFVLDRNADETTTQKNVNVCNSQTTKHKIILDGLIYH